MRKPFSFGSLLMMAVTLLVAAGLVYVLPRLSSGKMPDLNLLREQTVLLFSDDMPEQEISDIRLQLPDNTPAVPTARVTAVPTEPSDTVVSGSGVFTVNIGGTVSIGDKIRKSAYASESKAYDFTEFLSLLKPLMDGDLNIAFLENLCLDSVQVSSLVLPYQAPEMLSAAGFDTVFTGFSKLADKGDFCVSEHLDALVGKKLRSFGAWKNEPDPSSQIVNVGNVKVALLQYTEALTSAGVKTVRKTGMTWLVPTADADGIARDIESVRNAGAQVVLVGLSWGKTDASKPTEAQKTLAQKIADAGADLIIGSGSQVVQPATMISAVDGREVFCAYSIGSLINPNRDKVTRMAGMVLHLAVECDGKGNVRLQEAGYIPTYTWYYKMDGLNYYRTIAADRDLPDGMSSDQMKNCSKAANQVAKMLEGSPVVLR